MPRGMLRIHEIAKGLTDTTLSVEGRVVSDWVTVLEDECRRALQDSARVQLDLAAVTFIDARGVALLRSLTAEGVALVKCPEFIDTLLEP